MSVGVNVGNPYRALFAVPGARIFVAAGFVGRMSMSMLGIGIVLLVTSVTGSYGIAGSVSAISSLAFAGASPVIGRMSDRLGQARVLPPLAAANAVSLLALILTARLSAPTWTFYVAGIAIGLTSPSVGAMVRARWSHLLEGSPHLHTAYSFESVADEVIFVTGPMLVAWLATAVSPSAGLAAAGGFTLVGCLALAALRGTQPPPRPVSGGTSGSAIRIPEVMVVAGVFLLLGSMFAAVDVSSIAFTQEQGHKALAGVLLGCFALGSAVGGLWFGARHWRAPLYTRFRIGLGLLALGMMPLQFIHNLYLMMGMAFVTGLSISPTLITGFGLIESSVPAGQLTEGLTWVSTSIGVGVAIGSTVAGKLVDSFGAMGAYHFPFGAGLCAFVIGVLGGSRFHKTQET